MIIYNSEIYHYGIPRRSGRYKWGSGKNPFHHGADGGARKIKRLEKKANRMATMASMNKRAASDANNPFRSVNNINAKYYGRKASKYKQRLENAKAGKAYKQTAEYKAARRKKIAAIAAGTTAAAASAYLATHPEARQRIKGLFNKKNGRKFTEEELHRMGIETFKPETFKPETFKVDRVEIPRTNVNDPLAAARHFAKDRAKKEGSSKANDPLAAARHFAKDNAQRNGRQKNDFFERGSRINNLSKKAAAEGAVRREKERRERDARNLANEMANERMFRKKQRDIANRNARTIGYNRYIKGTKPRPTRYGKIGTKRAYDMEYESWYDKDVYGSVRNRLRNNRYKGKTRRLR